MTDTPRTAADVLRAARELISVPDRWAKGGQAFTSSGLSVFHDDPDAVCWCALGAIWRSQGGIGREEYTDILRRAVGAEIIGDWNDADERTHAEVLAAFDRAIILAEKEQS